MEDNELQNTSKQLTRFQLEIELKMTLPVYCNIISFIIIEILSFHLSL